MQPPHRASLLEFCVASGQHSRGDDGIFAFRDLDPVNPSHLQIIPKIPRRACSILMVVDRGARAIRSSGLRYGVTRRPRTRRVFRRLDSALRQMRLYGRSHRTGLGCSFNRLTLPARWLPSSGPARRCGRPMRYAGRRRPPCVRCAGSRGFAPWPAPRPASGGWPGSPSGSPC